MEAPVTQRYPNFFTLLPTDVRNIIAAKLGGRTLTLLGGCSWLLNQYVKNAQEVWKRFYLESNLGANPAMKLNWREEYSFQGLVKRNIRLDNCIEYKLKIPRKEDFPLPEQVKAFFFHKKLYVTTDRDILCFDKKGQQQEIIPTPNGAKTTLEKVDEETLIVAERHNLKVRTLDAEVSLVDGSNLYTYDKHRIIYQRNDLAASVWLYDIKQGSYTQLPLFSCSALIGIHNNLLFVKSIDRFVIYNIDTKEKEYVPHNMYAYHQILVYPCIFFYSRSIISVYSCEDKKLRRQQSFGKITHDKSRVFLSKQNGIEKWDFKTQQFLPFAEALSPFVTILDRIQLLVAWPLNIASYNVDTGECNFRIPAEISSFYSNDCFVENNILFGIKAHYHLKTAVFDLEERKFINQSSHIQYICAEEGSFVCYPPYGGCIDYLTLKDFSQPLKSRKK